MHGTDVLTQVATWRQWWWTTEWKGRSRCYVTNAYILNTFRSYIDHTLSIFSCSAGIDPDRENVHF